jgi:hypothetical protein
VKSVVASVRVLRLTVFVRLVIIELNSLRALLTLAREEVMLLSAELMLVARLERLAVSRELLL